MTWSAAERRLSDVSSAAGAASLEADAAELTARSLDTLRRPTVTLSAQLVTYDKTLSVDLSDTRDGVANSLDAYLGALPGQFPADAQGIVQLVTQRIDAALPGLLAPIPDTLEYQASNTLFRPSVTAFLPLYTGGAIAAVQDGAGAAAAAARARADAADNLSRVNLARSYFGVTLAEGLEQAARDNLAAMDRHLANTEAFYREGVLPKARVLEVQVVRDAAARNLERATLERDRATAALQRLLQTESPVRPTTPLFVHEQSLAPVDAYVAAATGDHPRVREADATGEVAEAGVRLARSRSLPQAYAFGSYGIDGIDSGPTEPDWIAGVGVRWTLLSPVSRSKTLAAARMREEAAREGGEAARKAIASEVHDAWSLAEAARRSFLSLDSSMAAAQENLRVAEIAFREGEATATRLIDARATLTDASTQRLAAAYEYDVALAALMAASGNIDQYDVAIADAQRKIQP